MHSISSFALSNPEKANEMIARLGDFLRMTLENTEEQTVTLREELKFLRCYLEIEQIRFSDRLTVEFAVAEDTLSAEVPHLILQPIVENAVKHGIAPFSGKGKILIRSLRADEKTYLKRQKGLSNARSRLQYLCGDKFELKLTIDSDGTEVVLILPLKAEREICSLPKCEIGDFGFSIHSASETATENTSAAVFDDSVMLKSIPAV